MKIDNYYTFFDFFNIIQNVTSICSGCSLPRLNITVKGKYIKGQRVIKWTEHSHTIKMTALGYGQIFYLAVNLDVGSSHPGAGAGPKGLTVRQLKRYASWVQNVVRQFGLYPPWA